MSVFIKLLPSESGNYVEEETDCKSQWRRKTPKTQQDQCTQELRDQGRMHRGGAQDTSPPPTNRVSVMTPRLLGIVNHI